MAFQDIEIGQRSGFTVSDISGVVIEDDADWNVFWANHTAGRNPPTPRPPIDFSERFVFAAVLGKTTRVGYGIQVSSVGYETGTYIIGYRTAEPAEDCPTTKADINPYHIVAVDLVGPGPVNVDFVREGNEILPCE